MIEFIDIWKRFGRLEILQGLSLQLETGELALLLGANGAGKTTMLKIAAGALAENSGQVRFEGKDLSPDQRRQTFAYLPQGVAFQPRLTGRQLLRFYARALGASSDRIDPALERWGLIPHARKRSSELSGGLRQRLGLAILSLADMPVLLLDEPGLSLDAEWRERLQDWLKAEAERKKTIMVATHLLGEWEGRASRCFICRGGQIEGEISPSRLREEGLARISGLVKGEEEK